jgi:hypothetical protein
VLDDVTDPAEQPGQHRDADREEQPHP